MTLTNPRPIVETAGDYYQSLSYISHSSKSAGLIDRIYLIIRHFTIKWKYRLVNPHLNNKSLLDVGCGTGNFVAYCKSQGIDVAGVEPSAEARAKASENRISVYESLNQLPDIKYEVITLWHVLEHIYALDETIQKLKSKLSESGTIFIAVPNFESEDAKHYKSLWAGFDVPRHVWHFSKKIMEKLLEKHELKVVNEVPMKLDSYYVSLLSEKNGADGKLSIPSLIRALVNGFRSNRKGKQEMNYSSIIYMIQR